jgi:hypothetical protein
MEAISMSKVEAQYDQYWREAGGMARIQRTASLYASFREMLEFQVRKANPDLSDREVTIRAARRMYLSDEAVQRLLDQMENALCTMNTSEPPSSKSVPSSTI